YILLFFNHSKLGFTILYFPEVDLIYTCPLLAKNILALLELLCPKNIPCVEPILPNHAWTPAVLVVLGLNPLMYTFPPITPIVRENSELPDDVLFDKLT